MMRFAVVLCLLFLLACERGAETAPAPAAAPAPLPERLKEVVRLIGQRRFGEARAMAGRYVDANPDDGRGHFMIGFAWHKQDNHGPAVESFREALERSPDYVITHHYLAESLFLLGDVQGAGAHHAAHLDAVPDDPDALYGLGMVALEGARFEDAEMRFDRVIEVIDAMKTTDPRGYVNRAARLGAAHARLADIYFARDDYTAARSALLESTTIAPQNITAFHTLALVHRRLGDDALADAAEARYQAALEARIRAGRGGG